MTHLDNCERQGRGAASKGERDGSGKTPNTWRARRGCASRVSRAANLRCVGDMAWFAWLGCGEVELRAGGGNGGALVAVARARRRKVAARACEDGVLRRRGPAVAAHGGGAMERRWRSGTARGGGA